MKTNAMRILDAHKISYKVNDYTNLDVISGMDVSMALNENPNQVFKTLVAQSKSKKYYVFLIPVNQQLDLKKCAILTHEKSIFMIAQKELLGLTGYIHGGCSPIGMKKQFETFIDTSVTAFEDIFISGGKIGLQIEMKYQDLKHILHIEEAHLIVT